METCKKYRCFMTYMAPRPWFAHVWTVVPAATYLHFTYLILGYNSGGLMLPVAWTKTNQASQLPRYSISQFCKTRMARRNLSSLFPLTAQWPTWKRAPVSSFKTDRLSRMNRREAASATVDSVCLCWAVIVLRSLSSHLLMAAGL